MLLNIVLDFALGLVPFLGDLADAVFRANSQNAWILEEYLVKKAEEEGRTTARPVAAPNNGERVLSPTRLGPAKMLSDSLRGAFGKSRAADEEMAIRPVDASQPRQ